MLRPHHSYIEGNMVVLETAGPWDADDLKELIHLMAPVKDTVAGQDWGMLLVLQEMKIK